MGFPVPVRRHLYIESGPWVNITWHQKTMLSYLHIRYCHPGQAASANWNGPKRPAISPHKQCDSHILWDLLRKIYTINSLTPGRYEWDFSKAIFNLNLVIDGSCISSEIALRWLSLNLTDGKSISVQVMAWCRQATSHYLSQYWPRPMSPYGITRPQWLNSSGAETEIFQDNSSLPCLQMTWLQALPGHQQPRYWLWDK